MAEKSENEDFRMTSTEGLCTEEGLPTNERLAREKEKRGDICSRGESPYLNLNNNIFLQFSVIL